MSLAAQEEPMKGLSPPDSILVLLTWCHWSRSPPIKMSPSVPGRVLAPLSWGSSGALCSGFVGPSACRSGHCPARLAADKGDIPGLWSHVRAGAPPCHS